MGTKFGILWNRLETKKLLKAAMAQPQHNQNRSELKATISKWKRDVNSDVVAVDISKFDKGHGGDVLRLFARHMARVTGSRQVEDDFMAEVTMPLMVSYSTGLFFTSDEIAPQLPSGVSFTTVAGLFFGDYVSRFIVKQAGGNLAARGSQWDYLNWGDDMLIRMPKEFELSSKLDAIGQRLGLALTEEPTLKYLGFNYGSGEYQAREGYSIGRLLIKQFFPERPKAYPYSTIGYGARLDFIPGAKQFHEKFSRIAWDERLYGPKFAFADRRQAVAKAMEKAALETAPDTDALNFLLHGLDPDEGQRILSDAGISLDVSDWIGGQYSDLTDPRRFLTEDVDFDASRYSRYISNLETSGVAALPALMTQFATDQDLRTDGGIIW